MVKNLKLRASVFEKGLRRLADQLSAVNGAKKIILDHTSCTHYTPAAILLLLSKVKEWEDNGIEVEFVNHKSDFFQYLQRVNFFKHHSINTEENFIRHDPKNRFIPIVEFGPNSRNDQEIDKEPDRLAAIIADIAVTETENEHVINLKRGISYSCGELLMNVIQHSSGTGYAFAQYVPYKDFVRIAILDNGIGIKDSFKVNKSKHYTKGMTDLGAIKEALKYEVSCKPIGPRYENAGVGLTYLNRLSKHAGDDMTIISNSGLYNEDHNIDNDSNFICGTLCSITLKRGMLNNFQELLRQVKNSND